LEQLELRAVLAADPLHQLLPFGTAFSREAISAAWLPDGTLRLVGSTYQEISDLVWDVSPAGQIIRSQELRTNLGLWNGKHNNNKRISDSGEWIGGWNIGAT
jgi:hypothetical protein